MSLWAKGERMNGEVSWKCVDNWDIASAISRARKTGKGTSFGGSLGYLSADYLLNPGNFRED